LRRGTVYSQILLEADGIVAGHGSLLRLAFFPPSLKQQKCTVYITAYTRYFLSQKRENGQVLYSQILLEADRILLYSQILLEADRILLCSQILLEADRILLYSQILLEADRILLLTDSPGS
jgi:hypothetical protein